MPLPDSEDRPPSLNCPGGLSSVHTKRSHQETEPPLVRARLALTRLHLRRMTARPGRTLPNQVYCSPAAFVHYMSKFAWTKYTDQDHLYPQPPALISSPATMHHQQRSGPYYGHGSSWALPGYCQEVSMLQVATSYSIANQRRDIHTGIITCWMQLHTCQQSPGP